MIDTLYDFIDTPPPGEPGDEWTIAQVKAWVKANSTNRNGCLCPVCLRPIVTRKRNINHQMAAGLIYIYRHFGMDEVHVPTIRKETGMTNREEGRLKHWGLVLGSSEKRADGGKAGYWRLTEKGAAFTRAEIAVQKYAHIFRDQCLAFSGELVRIHDCLRTGFNYSEMMSDPLAQVSL